MSQDQSNTSPNSFPNGRHTILLETSPNATANEIITQLKLDKHKAVILILGETDIPDADSRPRLRLLQLFSRGLARAVAENDVLIIDGGIESEVMTGLGKALLGRASNVQLLGIANESKLNIPRATTEQASNAQSPGITNDGQITNTVDSANGRKTLESYHTHFVAVKSTNSDSEVDQMYALAVALSEGPILTVLVNDSPLAKDEVVRSVRQRWPVLVITGSGGFADEIQQAWQAKQDYIVALSQWNKSSSKGTKPVPPFVPDPVLAEVIADGDLHFFSITDLPENLERRIDLRLKANSILKEVYEQQQVYSADARQKQGLYRLGQNSILILGVLITALAALAAFSRQMQWNIPIQFSIIKVNFPNDVLSISLISVPVVLALLIAGTNRFNPGNKYITRRTAAEAFKREMFRYRTRTGIYSDSFVAQNGTARQAKLASMIEAITRQWVEGNLEYTIFPGQASSRRSKKSQTGSNTKQSGQGKPKDSPSDYLPPNRYITDRLDNQVNYYKNSSLKLGRQLLLYEWLILGLGGFATFLAALQADLIITVTTACVTALVTFLEYNQVSNNLKQYNHAVLSLTNIKNWWIALGDDQADQSNVDKLVDYVETTLQSENAGWVQQMQAALTELRAQQAKQGADSSATEPINKSLEGKPSPNNIQNGAQPTANLANAPSDGTGQEDGSDGTAAITTPANVPANGAEQEGNGPDGSTPTNQSS